LFTKTGYIWRFYRAGGLDQVRIDSADDLRHLPDLDLKHWVALSCPVKGLEFDRRTLELIDTDKDGRIRVPEILAAVAMVASCLRDPAQVFKGASSLPLASIDENDDRGKTVLAAARRLLTALKKPEADSVTLYDITAIAAVLVRHGAPGDGVVPPSAVEDESLRRVLEDIISTLGPQTAAGAEGVDKAKADAFFAALAEFSEWSKAGEGAAGSAMMPFGAATPEAFAACDAVRAKVEDYFTRCRMAEFDARAGAVLNRAEADYAALAARDLTAETEGIAGLPLQHAAARRPLDLEAGINPAWAERIARFRAAVCAPMFGAASLADADWRAVEARLAPHAEWRRSKKGAVVEKLGLERVRELLAGDARAKVDALIQRDIALAAEIVEIEQVERLIRYHRDLYTLLRNFVNFANFYDPSAPAIFDAGRLYLDQRACHMCVRVENMGNHSSFSGLSRMFLAYCDCMRPGGEKMGIVAAFTQGDSDYLTVGRNGIFYDRQGRDWDATIVKVIENPISIRQAFWMPYKRLAKFISEQIDKFGASKDKAAHDAAAAQVSGTMQAAEAGKAAKKEPFDIAKFAGIFAAIGLAIGAIGGAMGAMLAAFAGLAWWQMPLAIAGIMIVVSGPAMIIAWFKLRHRTMGPILEGNGWAINGRVKVNIPLGNSLTELRRVPMNARLSLKDPFEDKAAARSKRLFALFLLLAALAVLVWWRWQDLAPLLDSIW
jgi:hypothetical protein